VSGCSVCSLLRDRTVRYYRDVPEEPFVILDCPQTGLPLLSTREHRERFNSLNDLLLAYKKLKECCTNLFGANYALVPYWDKQHFHIRVRALSEVSLTGIPKEEEALDCLTEPFRVGRHIVILQSAENEEEN